MVKVLLDTCVVSELQRAKGNPRVREQVAAFDPKNVYVSAVTIGEVAKGIALLAAGARQRELTAWLLGFEQRFASAILPIDTDVARMWGEVTARARSQGIQIPILDGFVAATALHHGMHVITRNTKHFVATGVLIIDPWSS